MARMTEKAKLMAEAKLKGLNLVDSTGKPLYFTTPQLRELVHGRSSIKTKTKEWTDEEIKVRIANRFDTMMRKTKSCIDGNLRAMIVSGPPGIGKSFGIESMLREHDPRQDHHTIFKGTARATGLYKALWDHREEGDILVFDDCDAVFWDEDSLNILKAALDTTKVRKISYLKESNLISDADQSKIPNNFEFHGAVIFITNINFDKLIHQDGKLGPHLHAIQDRAEYIDLTLRSRRDLFCRIQQVLEEDRIISDLSVEDRKEVVKFIKDNLESFRTLSLRTLVKLGQTIRQDRATWKKDAMVTHFKAEV